MIYFYNNLVELAKGLIDAIKAGEDLAQIKFMKNHTNPSQEFISVAKRLHEKLQED